ncbi:MAG: hypothetical protein ABFD18_15165 [Syntrophomonas sp.]
MEKRFKKILVGMLVMSMLAGGVFSAQADTRDAETETAKSKAVVAQCLMTSPPISDIQYQKFIAYLTHEYAPELQAEWEKAFADRAGIKLPVPSDLPANVNITSINKMGNIKFGTVTVTAKSPDKTEPNAEVESPEIFMSIAQNPGGKLDPETDVINATEVTTELKPGADCITVTLPQENGGNFPEQLKLQDELDEAITSNDGKAINTVLGKMLTNYNAVSEDMKSALSKVEITTTEK